MRLEPTIFGLGGRRVIHYATEAGVNNTVTKIYYFSDLQYIGNFTGFGEHTQ